MTRPWVWPWRPSRRVAEAVDYTAAFASPLLAGRAWPVVAVLVGVLPVLGGYAVGSFLHQPLTAFLLAPLFWAAVRQDAFPKAVGLVALVMGTHSAVVVTLSAFEPAEAAAVLPGATDYWGRTRHWIETGTDPEYDWTVWLPAHLLLLAVVPLAAYTSVGLVPFALAVHQLDLMNFYVGQLVREGDNPPAAVLFGWHPWSVLRGAAYTVLVYEAASVSLERLTGRPLSTRRRRFARLALGLTLAAADAAAKLLLAPVIRDELFVLLHPPGAS